jgi:Na+-transporting NADH:ubiquinone oxidoreductase subunit C
MKDILRSVLFMFGIALVFTSLVSLVKLANEDRIDRNQKVKLQRTVLKVLGIKGGEVSTAEEVTRIFEKRIKVDTSDGRTIYICHGKDNKTITGYAFPVSGPGFWGPIYGMAAVNSDATELLGVSFYRHSETPGLGGRISEEWFSRQFEGLSLHTVEGNNKIFYLTPPADKKRINDLDAITGASRTSDAVEQFLNRDLDLFIRNFQKTK